MLPRLIFGIMGLNLVVCTAEKFKALSKSVLVMHLGTMLVLAGTVVSSFGYIATVNVYEGTTVDTVYRWDIKQDVPLGLDLTVKKANIEYYPIPVRVGVRRGAKKIGLFELKTGESFSLEGYTVKVDSLEVRSEVLSLSVWEGDRFVGSADTNGMRDLPPDFPFEFVLVAYQNARLKRVWVDLSLSRNSHIVAEGSSEVNEPLTWGNLAFYNIKLDNDLYGARFAGIQITKDPGKPFVFIGFTTIGAGAACYLLRRFLLKGRKQ